MITNSFGAHLIHHPGYKVTALFVPILSLLQNAQVPSSASCTCNSAPQWLFCRFNATIKHLCATVQAKHLTQGSDGHAATSLSCSRKVGMLPGSLLIGGNHKLSWGPSFSCKISPLLLKSDLQGVFWELCNPGEVNYRQCAGVCWCWPANWPLCYTLGLKVIFHLKCFRCF